MEGIGSVMEIFFCEESKNNKYLVKVRLDKVDFFTPLIRGSWSVFCARVMGLHFADYLRYCRDNFGAEIIGKGSKYPVAFFPLKENANKLVDILNDRWKIISKEIENNERL